MLWTFVAAERIESTLVRPGRSQRSRRARQGARSAMTATRVSLPRSSAARAAVRLAPTSRRRNSCSLGNSSVRRCQRDWGAREVLAAVDGDEEAPGHVERLREPPARAGVRPLLDEPRDGVGDGREEVRVQIQHRLVVGLAAEDRIHGQRALVLRAALAARPVRLPGHDELLARRRRAVRHEAEELDAVGVVVRRGPGRPRIRAVVEGLLPGEARAAAVVGERGPDGPQGREGLPREVAHREGAPAAIGPAGELGEERGLAARGEPPFFAQLAGGPNGGWRAFAMCYLAWQALAPLRAVGSAFPYDGRGARFSWKQAFHDRTYTWSPWPAPHHDPYRVQFFGLVPYCATAAGQQFVVPRKAYWAGSERGTEDERTLPMNAILGRKPHHQAMLNLYPHLLAPVADAVAGLVQERSNPCASRRLPEALHVSGSLFVAVNGRKDFARAPVPLAAPHGRIPERARVPPAGRRREPHGRARRGAPGQRHARRRHRRPRALPRAPRPLAPAGPHQGALDPLRGDERPQHGRPRLRPLRGLSLIHISEPTRPY